MRQFYSSIQIMIFSLMLMQSGCSNIFPTKSRHNLLSEAQPNLVAMATGKDINLSGQWTVGFRIQGTSTAGVMWLKQNGHNFSGYGKDSEKGPEYKIEKGSIKSNEVIFLKRYNNEADPPVQYHGQFSYLSADDGQTPYMGGDFSKEVRGNVITGDWEAIQPQPNNTAAKVQVPAQKSADSQSVTNSTVPNPTVTNSGHIPDLSGKWQMAFEYNFKIIHSTVFLEQEGKKLSGHGLDDDTGNRFVIKKGWYSFPRIGFNREYISTAKTKHPIPIRDMSFKADITLVNDKDYQGPYLSGKTQGGGSWEAQRVN